MCWEKKKKEREKMNRGTIMRGERKQVEKYPYINFEIEKLDNMYVSCILSSHKFRIPYQMICDF